MLKIRLMRIGAKKRPFYRVVVVDERAKRTGAYVELLGTYNPLTEPKDIKLNKEKVDSWIKKGAQPSDGYLRMIGKAPQRPPRKPKKEKKEKPETPAAEGEQPKPEEAAAPAEVPVEETASSDVIASEAKQSTTQEEIATATPEGGPRDDEKEKDKKDEGSA